MEELKIELEKFLQEKFLNEGLIFGNILYQEEQNQIVIKYFNNDNDFMITFIIMSNEIKCRFEVLKRDEIHITFSLSRLSTNTINDIKAFLNDLMRLKIDYKIYPKIEKGKNIVDEDTSNKVKIENYLDVLNDKLIFRALELMANGGQCSASYLQRKLGIGWNRASRIVNTIKDFEMQKIYENTADIFQTIEIVKGKVKNI